MMKRANPPSTEKPSKDKLRFELPELPEPNGQPVPLSPIRFSFGDTPSPEGMFETTDIVFPPMDSPHFGHQKDLPALKNVSVERVRRNNDLNKSSKTTDIKPGTRLRLRATKRRPKLKLISLLKSDKNLPDVPTAVRELEEIKNNAAR